MEISRPGAIHIPAKNKVRLDQEFQKAQNKLFHIFYRDLQERLDKSQAEIPDKAPSKSSNSKIISYNKFNDEDREIEVHDLTNMISKEPPVERKPTKVPRDLSEDPVVKAELAKHNYNDLVELNRDFQFYVNHPEKFKKITRAKLRRNAQPTTNSQSNTLGKRDLGDRLRQYDVERDQSEFGFQMRQREIPRPVESGRPHGFMTQKERKKILKHLF